MRAAWSHAHASAKLRSRIEGFHETPSDEARRLAGEAEFRVGVLRKCMEFIDNLPRQPPGEGDAAAVVDVSAVDDGMEEIWQKRRRLLTTASLIACTEQKPSPTCV